MSSSVNGNKTNNYTFTSAPGSVTINPATLTYVANAATSTYGSAPSLNGGSVTGFVNGQNLSSATSGTLSFTTSATAANDVGSYAINGSGLTANHGNYVFVQAANNATALTVNPALLTVTANTTYSGTTDVTSAVQLTGLKNGDTLTVNSATAASSDVGSGNYISAISLGNGNGKASNYIVNTNGNNEIGRAHV